VGVGEGTDTAFTAGELIGNVTAVRVARQSGILPVKVGCVCGRALGTEGGKA
jgi:hypothetical protein